MFTIQAGKDTYIKDMAYGQIRTSAQPRLYKTVEEAQAYADAVMKEGRRLIEAYTGYADAEEKKVAKARKDTARIKAKLEELYTQPYIEVEKKVATARKQLENARWYLTNNSIKSYRQSSARIAKILEKVEVIGLQLAQKAL